MRGSKRKSAQLEVHKGNSLLSQIQPPLEVQESCFNDDDNSEVKIDQRKSLRVARRPLIAFMKDNEKHVSLFNKVYANGYDESRTSVDAGSDLVDALDYDDSTLTFGSDPLEVLSSSAGFEPDMEDDDVTIRRTPDPSTFLHLDSLYGQHARENQKKLLL